MIYFKKLNNVLETINKSYYDLRKDKIIGNETIRKLKEGVGHVDTRTIDSLCEYLDCQPGDIMEYVKQDGGHN